MANRYFVLSATLAALATARTDLDGCTRTEISSPAGASFAWIVPGTGELCDPLDCGGGRAPPKTTVPGCPQYTGTATYSPSYLPGYPGVTVSMASQTSTTSDGISSTSSTVDWTTSETETPNEADTTSAEASPSSSPADWDTGDTDTATSSGDQYMTSPTWSDQTTSSSTMSGSSSAAVPAAPAASPSITGQTTREALLCAVASSGCMPGSTVWSTAYQNSSIPKMATDTMTSKAAGGPSNPTTVNGYAKASTSSTAIYTDAAATTQAWIGAGLLMGLGALAAAL